MSQVRARRRCVRSWCQLGALATSLAATPGHATTPSPAQSASPTRLEPNPTTAETPFDPERDPTGEEPDGHDEPWGARSSAHQVHAPPAPGSDLRFLGYASFAHTRTLADSRDEAAALAHDTHLRVLQLRLLGPIPRVAGSFFLVTMRAEQTPRLSYALVRLPLGRQGHYLSLDSGAAGLSVARATSLAKHLLLDPPYHVVNAFEQQNAAAVELGGPLDGSRRLLARLFMAGGTGRAASAVGARQLPSEQQNPTWSVGCQLFVSALGVARRFDSQLLYVPAPPTLALYAGARYDERPQERFPAANFGLVTRAGRLFLASEAFGKQELVFRSTQLAYLVTLGGLVIPRRLLLGAEYGAYLAGELRAPPPSPTSTLGIDVATQHDEAQLRAVGHLYVYGGVGVVSVRYVLRDVRQARLFGDGFRREELLAAASLRF